MSSAPAVTMSSLAAQAYSVGYAHHGDIDLQLEQFESRLQLIIDKHLGPNAPVSIQLHLASSLRTTDLYLTIGCAQPTESAWKQFDVSYQRYIDSVARFVSPTNSVARELADNVMADLFLPDTTGASRIASFDGRQSLATWLRVVIGRRAINHQRLKWNSFERGDQLDVGDKTSVDRIEGAIRRKRYGAILNESFKHASESLNDRQRLMLLLRYDEGLRVVEIARLFGVHPSRITRQFQRLHLELQKTILSVLAAKYHLGPDAINECLRDIMENPEHSLLLFIKAHSEYPNRRQ